MQPQRKKFAAECLGRLAKRGGDAEGDKSIDLRIKTALVVPCCTAWVLRVD